MGERRELTFVVIDNGEGNISSLEIYRVIDGKKTLVYLEFYNTSNTGPPKVYTDRIADLHLPIIV